MSKYSYILLLFALTVAGATRAQQNIMSHIPGSMGGGSSGGKDSLRHRTGLEDSITINFRFLDSSRYRKFDSSINDFSKRFLIPPYFINLGNSGNPAKSLLFTPILKAGWDAGLHSLDPYMLRPELTRFFNTTRPYTEFGYLLGGKQETVVNVLHTQNINPNWNFAFQYHLLNSPGTFKNQNAAQSELSFNNYYQSPNRRYHLFFVLVNNKMQSAENGGLINNSDLDILPQNKNRLTIPVKLGPTSPGSASIFNASPITGTKYKVFNIMLRQQYDLGKKDSVVTDSVTVHLFYPKLRLEHTVQWGSYSYQFVDPNMNENSDTSYYQPYYNLLAVPDTFELRDKWSELVNDVSVYSFPDSKNPQQFVKLGASLQNLKGSFSRMTASYQNTWIHGEYRNKTKNQKWDAELHGEFYTSGLNFGDFNAFGSLQRLVSPKIGYLQAGFQDVNRTPSFIYNSASSFNFDVVNTGGFRKENIIRFFGSVDQPKYKLNLSANYYLITNYTYLTDYYKAHQSAAVFNLLQISATKEFWLTRHLPWIVEVTVQQRIGDGEVNVPLIYTRNRIGYDGNLGFKNLHLATGFEIKYNTPYIADGYSALQGQFFYKSSGKVALRAPIINAYFHFRVKSFTAYVRAENLNTVNVKDGFSFTNNNMILDTYPSAGFLFRLGIFWTFVN